MFPMFYPLVFLDPLFLSSISPSVSGKAAIQERGEKQVCGAKEQV